ncbi:MAG: histidine kinase [Rikenellaceae bacterium]
MFLKILLILSVVLQLFAAFSAIGLIRHTKYNAAWILFTIALTLMAALRFGEYIQISGARDLHLPADFFIWIGGFTSLCFAGGVLLVRRLLKLLQRSDVIARITQRRILNTVIQTEEKERARFSKDLHDGLGPLLSSAKMSLSALERTSDESQRELILNNTYNVINEAIISLREISNNLSPHVLMDFGLEKAIAAFIEKSQAKASFKIDLRSNLKDMRFDNNVEVVVFRVVCELLNNSFKHSGGDEISLELSYRENIISISYADNGCGFSLEGQDELGMGLSNISSRVNSLKGEVDIHSTPENGMSALVKINLTKQELWKKSAK